MQKEIKVALLGAGTVGGGVIQVLKNNAEEIEKRVGAPIRLVKVLDRHPERVAELDPQLTVTEDIKDIIDDPEIDIVVELLGREHPAEDYMAAALSAIH